MANLKDLIVNGVSRFIGKVYINDSHITTINNVAVTETPKFTDTVTTVTTTGSGNAVTAISASNGALTVTKGATFSNNSGTITQVTAGTGLSGGGTSGAVTLNHANSVTAQNTQAIYPVKIDAQGHISEYGAAVTPLTANSSLNAAKLTGTVAVANGGTGKTNGKDAANYFMNSLDTGSSTPVDADYYISQYVSGGTTTTTYHRRPMSALWTYIKSKIDANGSYANKNAFSNASVGATTIAADSPSDTLNFSAGANVLITADTSNNNITIGAVNTTYSVATQSTNGLMSYQDKSYIELLKSNPVITVTSSNTKITISYTQPSGGTAGDIWFVMED